MEHYVIQNCNIIDVRNQRVLCNCAVEVKGTKIAAVGPQAQAERVVDGRGMWMIPGLVEMHGHFYTPGTVQYDIKRPDISGYISSLEASLPLYLANGVTTMASKNDEDAIETTQARESIEIGRRIGPRILTAGICLNREPKILPAIVAARTVEELLDAYRYQQGKIDFVKVYIFMTADWLSELTQAAHADGLKVYGHIEAMTAEEAVRAGIDGLEHGVAYMPEFKRGEVIPPNTPKGYLAPYANFDPRSDKAKALLDLFLEHDTALTPTVSCLEAFNSPDMANDLAKQNVWAYYSEEIRDAIRTRYEKQIYGEEVSQAHEYFQDFLARQAEFMATFHRAGGRIFAGTDPSVTPIFGGMTMAREAWHLQSFGMTPFEVLAAMTVESAKELGIDHKTGAVESGLEADLVLLEKNPLMDMKHLESVHTVIKAGKIYDPLQLRQQAMGKIK